MTRKYSVTEKGLLQVIKQRKEEKGKESEQQQKTNNRISNI
jgi:hypothetical protein